MTEIEMQILYNQVIIMEALSSFMNNEVQERNLGIYVESTLCLLKRERVQLTNDLD